MAILDAELFFRLWIVDEFLFEPAVNILEESSLLLMHVNGRLLEGVVLLKKLCEFRDFLCLRHSKELSKK